MRTNSILPRYYRHYTAKSKVIMIDLRDEVSTLFRFINDYGKKSITFISSVTNFIEVLVKCVHMQYDLGGVDEECR